MLKKLAKENMYTSNLGWLQSRFHFSFAEYRNFDNMNFGVLRVLNDDIIGADTGFDMHPHKDMEIISYIVRGEMTHKDSMGNEEVLKRGEVQYMSAGTGVLHSEHNKDKSKDLRLLQIWITPPQKDLKPLYGSYKYKHQERENKLLEIVSSQDKNAKIKIYQDVSIYVAELDAEQELCFSIKENRQVYFVQIEGTSSINNVSVSDGDAIEITEEKELLVKAESKSHFLFIEMPTLKI